MHTHTNLLVPPKTANKLKKKKKSTKPRTKQSNNIPTPKTKQSRNMTQKPPQHSESQAPNGGAKGCQGRTTPELRTTQRRPSAPPAAPRPPQANTKQRVPCSPNVGRTGDSTSPKRSRRQLSADARSPPVNTHRALLPGGSQARHRPQCQQQRTARGQPAGSEGAREQSPTSQLPWSTDTPRVPRWF